MKNACVVFASYLESRTKSAGEFLLCFIPSTHVDSAHHGTIRAGYLEKTPSSVTSSPCTPYLRCSSTPTRNSISSGPGARISLRTSHD